MEEILYSMNPWWEEEWNAPGISRGKYLGIMKKSLGKKEIFTLVGLRRVGKTTLLYQFIGHLLKGNAPKKVLYVSMDHPAFEKYSILDIVRTYQKIHGLARTEKIFLFLDEVHLKVGWEKDLKAIYDFGNAKVFISGSSSLLLKYKGAYLTGRMMKHIMQPLDFEEFLLFKKKAAKKSEGYLLEKWLEDYLKTGGIPEFVLEGDINYPIELLDNIINKDIVAAYKIKNPAMVKDMLISLARRLGFRTSYNKLGNVFGVKSDTIKDYISFLEEAFVVSTVKKFSYSINEQIYSPKKIYFSDLGLRNALIGFRDLGSLAENAVLIKLSGEFGGVFYHRNMYEVDFVIKHKGNAVPIEVKWDIEGSDWAESIKGLKRFMQEHKLKRGFLITKGTAGLKLDKLDKIGAKDAKGIKGITVVSLVDFLMKGLPLKS